MALCFCPRCGSALAEGATRCHACSSSCEDWQRDLENAITGGAVIEPLEEKGRAEAAEEEDIEDAEIVEPAEAITPASMSDANGTQGAMAPRPVMRDTSKLRQTDSWSLDHRTFKLLIAGVVGVSVLVFAFVSVTFGGLLSGFSDPQATHVVPGGYVEQQAENAGGEASGEEEAPPEDPALEPLRALHGEMGELASKVSTAEEDFIDDWSVQRSVREGHSAEVIGLAEEAQALLTKVEGTTIALDSTLTSEYNSLLICARKLVSRTMLLGELWKVDLYYNYPQSYPDTILAEYYNNSNDEGDFLDAIEFKKAFDAIEL